MSDNKKTSVLGIYNSRESVERAVDTFIKSGFATSDVSVLLPENLGSKPIATHKDTKAPEGATAGGGAGAVIGGTLGLLAGIGALAIPGVGPFIAAGPIMAALAGAGALGTVGGIVGALVGMGIPEYEAKRYEGRVKNGGILLSVHCDDHDWVKRGEEIMKRTGAEDISSTSEAHADFAVSDKPMLRSRSPITEEPVVITDNPPVDPNIAASLRENTDRPSLSK
jgi:hypothetical protein